MENLELSFCVNFVLVLVSVKVIFELEDLGDKINCAAPENVHSPITAGATEFHGDRDL